MSRYRFEWLKAVMQTKLSPTTKNVATALAVQFCNEETRQCNPKIETIGEYLNSHPDTVKRSIRELKKAGWLVSRSSRGRGKSADYDLVSDGKIVPFTRPENRGKSSSSHQQKGGDMLGKGGQITPSHIMKEQSLEQKARATSSSPYPVEQQSLIECGSHRWAAWNAWLAERNWPSLEDLTALHVTSGCVLPSPMPPAGDSGIGHVITERVLRWARCQMIELRSASA